MKVPQSSYSGEISNASGLEVSLEELELNGYTIIEDQLTESLVSQLERDLLNSKNISETIRNPFLGNASCVELARKIVELPILKQFYGPYAKLLQQNGIVNLPQNTHEQSRWHRDLPYQEWTSSSPLSLSIFTMVSDFTSDNGSTIVLPGSHKRSTLPSLDYINKHAKQIVGRRSSLLVMDSMLFHTSGINGTKKARIGVNTMYGIPHLKAQFESSNLGFNLNEEVRELIRFSIV